MADIESIIERLLAKGSEGDGSLILNKEDTQALAEYVRRLRKFNQAAVLTIQIDGREVARALAPQVASCVRIPTGPRTY